MCESCEKAASRAYIELRDFGRPDRNAFESAVRLYRSNHPEVGQHDACLAVADCLAEEA